MRGGSEGQDHDGSFESGREISSNMSSSGGGGRMTFEMTEVEQPIRIVSRRKVVRRTSSAIRHSPNGQKEKKSVVRTTQQLREEVAAMSALGATAFSSSIKSSSRTVTTSTSTTAPRRGSFGWAAGRSTVKGDGPSSNVVSAAAQRRKELQRRRSKTSLFGDDDVDDDKSGEVNDNRRRLQRNSPVPQNLRSTSPDNGEKSGDIGDARRRLRQRSPAPMERSRSKKNDSNFPLSSSSPLKSSKQTPSSRTDCTVSSNSSNSSGDKKDSTTTPKTRRGKTRPEHQNEEDVNSSSANWKSELLASVLESGCHNDDANHTTDTAAMSKRPHRKKGKESQSACLFGSADFEFRHDPSSKTNVQSEDDDDDNDSLGLQDIAKSPVKDRRSASDNYKSRTNVKASLHKSFDDTDLYKTAKQSKPKSVRASKGSKQLEQKEEDIQRRKTLHQSYDFEFESTAFQTTVDDHAYLPTVAKESKRKNIRRSKSTKQLEEHTVESRRRQSLHQSLDFDFEFLASSPIKSRKNVQQERLTSVTMEARPKKKSGQRSKSSELQVMHSITISTESKKDSKENRTRDKMRKNDDDTSEASMDDFAGLKTYTKQLHSSETIEKKINNMDVPQDFSEFENDFSFTSYEAEATDFFMLKTTSTTTTTNTTSKSPTKLVVPNVLNPASHLDLNKSNSLLDRTPYMEDEFWEPAENEFGFTVVSGASPTRKKKIFGTQGSSKDEENCNHTDTFTSDPWGQISDSPNGFKTFETETTISTRQKSNEIVEMCDEDLDSEENDIESSAVERVMKKSSRSSSVKQQHKSSDGKQKSPRRVLSGDLQKQMVNKHSSMLKGKSTSSTTTTSSKSSSEPSNDSNSKTIASNTSTNSNRRRPSADGSTILEQSRSTNRNNSGDIPTSSSENKGPSRGVRRSKTSDSEFMHRIVASKAEESKFFASPYKKRGDRSVVAENEIKNRSRLSRQGSSRNMTSSPLDGRISSRSIIESRGSQSVIPQDAMRVSTSKTSRNRGMVDGNVNEKSQAPRRPGRRSSASGNAGE